MTGTTFQVLFNLSTCSNYSITNYDKFPMFHFLERVNKTSATKIHNYLRCSVELFKVLTRRSFVSSILHASREIIDFKDYHIISINLSIKSI